MTCIPLIAMLGLSISGCATPTPPAVDTTPAFYRSLDASDGRVDPIAARDMISIYRHNHAQAVLTLDPQLQREAETQVQAMARANALDSAASKNLSARLAAAGDARGASAENISAGYHTLAEAFSGWRDSPPHNAVMLNPKMRRMGIATAYAPGSKYKVFWALVLSD
jgi:uncharacterized protein YkwD